MCVQGLHPSLNCHTLGCCHVNTECIDPTRYLSTCLTSSSWVVFPYFYGACHRLEVGRTLVSDWIVWLGLRNEPRGQSQVQLSPGSVSGCVLQGKLQSVLVGSSLSGGFVGFSLGFLLYYKHEIGAWWWERKLQEENSGAILVKKEACVPRLFTLLILLEGDVLRLRFCTMLYICKVLQKTLIKHISFFSFSPALAFLSLLSSIPYSFSPSQVLSDKWK